MASYDVAVWRWSEDTWPQITLLVEAESARHAMIVVLQTQRVRRAVKVAVNSGDGFIHRWYSVTTRPEGLDCQRCTCVPMGRPVAGQALVETEGGNTHGA
ncbi:MAG TPA: hypothetical protein VJ761_10830 [Ktedonobacteraceae bacterium]|nr:hypothetical protein [Ktedonobacteraceae bacterium]